MFKKLTIASLLIMSVTALVGCTSDKDKEDLVEVTEYLDSGQTLDSAMDVMEKEDTKLPEGEVITMDEIKSNYIGYNGFKMMITEQVAPSKFKIENIEHDLPVYISDNKEFNLKDEGPYIFLSNSASYFDMYELGTVIETLDVKDKNKEGGSYKLTKRLEEQPKLLFENDVEGYKTYLTENGVTKDSVVIATTKITRIYDKQ